MDRFHEVDKAADAVRKLIALKLVQMSALSVAFVAGFRVVWSWVWS